MSHCTCADYRPLLLFHQLSAPGLYWLQCTRHRRTALRIPVWAQSSMACRDEYRRLRSVMAGPSLMPTCGQRYISSTRYAPGVDARQGQWVGTRGCCGLAQCTSPSAWRSRLKHRPSVDDSDSTKTTTISSTNLEHGRFWTGIIHTRSNKVSRCVILVLSGSTCTKLKERAKYEVPGTLEPEDGSLRMEYASPNANRAKNLH